MASSQTSLNPADLFSVKGMVALITGGGTGIGLMMARALAAAGASKIYIAGRRLEVLQKAADSINIDQPDTKVVVPLVCDVTSTSSLNSLVDHITKESGHLHLLLCNSGVGGPQAPAPVTTTDKPPTSLKEWREANLAIPMEDFTQTFVVNVSSAWYTTMACLELLDKGNKEGNSLGWTTQVIVTSSIGGFNKKAPGGWAYGQSKAAATHAMKQLGAVLPTWGIRANALAPGLFPSEMSAPIVKAMGGNMEGEGIIPVDVTAVPLGRMGNVQEMGGTLLWMASRAGGYCNGNVVVIDGGRLTTMPSCY